MNDSKQCIGDVSLDLRNATEEDLTTMFYNQFDKYIILVCFSILFIVGYLGNGAFLLVVALIDEMRTKTNFYLANLAVADLVFIATQMYDVFLNYLVSPRLKTLLFQSSAGCSILYTTLFTTHFATVGFVFLVALERYLAICKPLKHRAIVAKGRTVKLVITTWIFSLVYAATLITPHFFVIQKICIIWPNDEQYQDVPSFTIKCVPVHPAYNAFPDMVQSVPYILVLVICIYMYGSIMKQLNSSMPSSAIKDDIKFELKAKKTRNQVARLLIVNAMVYFLCFLPHFVIRFNDALIILTETGVDFSDKVWYILYWANRAIATVNSVVNPFIYSITNSRYRQAFCAVLACRKKPKTDPTIQSRKTYL